MKRNLRILRPLSEILIPVKRYKVEIRKIKTQKKPTRTIRFNSKQEADKFISANSNKNIILIIGL